MTSREKVREIFSHKGNAPCYWTGNPSPETVEHCAAEWGIPAEREAMFSYLKDDCRWIAPWEFYFDPEGRPWMPTSVPIPETKGMTTRPIFADAETVADIEKYPWPDPAYCDFSATYAEIDAHPDQLVFTGVWSHFFHIVADMFGMEKYFTDMYENPALVEAVTQHVVDFFVEANDKFFAGLGDRADTMFFGNDFGTQRDLFMSLKCFDKFIMPSFRRLIGVGKKYGKYIMLHSCGSIWRVIPRFIDAGVDVLHPIQAGAANMDAVSLSQYKNDISFVGGIDAQSFFVNATAEEMKREVDRVYSVLGPNIVISPSHEQILPNIPPRNVKAMSDAVEELRKNNA